MTVEELLGRISSRELSEWIAYAKTNPFGEYRADLRAALIASTIANMAIASAGGKQNAYKIEDFMLNFGKPKKVEPMESEVMWNMLKSIAGARK